MLDIVGLSLVDRRSFDPIFPAGVLLRSAHVVATVRRKRASAKA
jgi:hypothetical protein